MYVYMYVYVYVCVYVYMYVYVYIYIYVRVCVCMCIYLIVNNYISVVCGLDRMPVLFIYMHYVRYHILNFHL